MASTNLFRAWFTRIVPGLAGLLTCRRSDFSADAVAGLSVAAVSLPVGIAYAEIAGVPAVYGIYAAIVPLVAYALFGSSRQLIIGPDAATCLMVAASIGPLAGGDPQRYLELVVALTLATGLFYVLFGLCRFGFLANFLSHPILVGYLNGVALIILVGQIPKLFGYQSAGGDFWHKLLECIKQTDHINPPTLLLGTTGLALLLIMKRWAPRLPAALIVGAVSIAAVAALNMQARGVAVLGAIPAGLPVLRAPAFDPTRSIVVQHAASIALISFISGILTAKSFARRNRYDIDANRELIAFGACNIVSGLVQGFPVTGAASRTALSNAMGGKTQLVGLVAAVAMLLFLLVLTKPLALLPNAALAAIIIVSCLSLFDISSVRELYQASRRELAFSLVTTAGVLYFGVMPAVFLAIGLTMLCLLLAVSQPNDAVLGQAPGVTGFHNIADYPNAVTTPGLLLYRFESSLLFFNVDYFKERLMTLISRTTAPVQWVVVDAGSINFVDITALHKLLDLREELAERGIDLKFARVKQSLWRFFSTNWVEQYKKGPRLNTLDSVVEAFCAWQHQQAGSNERNPPCPANEPATP